MGMQRFTSVTVISLAAVFFLLLIGVIVTPLVHAADEPSAEAAEVTAPAIDLELMRAEIAAEDDPEMRAAMEEQFQLLESGQLDLQTLERDMRGHTDDGSVVLPENLRGGSTEGQTGGTLLPKEAQAELEKIFSQGTGDPSKDSHLREQAEKVMEKYGVEHPTFGGGDSEGRGGGMESGGSMREVFERGGGLEQRGEGFERAMLEHMAPEAREQMERLFDHDRAGGGRSEMERGERSEMEHGGRSDLERGGHSERERGSERAEREVGQREQEREHSRGSERETGGQERSERESMGSSQEREQGSSMRERESSEPRQMESPPHESMPEPPHP